MTNFCIGQAVPHLWMSEENKLSIDELWNIKKFVQFYLFY
jgi:hypothetical protein